MIGYSIFNEHNANKNHPFTIALIPRGGLCALGHHTLAMTLLYCIMHITYPTPRFLSTGNMKYFRSFFRGPKIARRTTRLSLA